jgi:hypothetical protein
MEVVSIEAELEKVLHPEHPSDDTARKKRIE